MPPALSRCALRGIVLVVASALFYGGGWARTVATFSPSGREAEMRHLATQLVEEPNIMAYISKPFKKKTIFDTINKVISTDPPQSQTSNTPKGRCRPTSTVRYT